MIIDQTTKSHIVIPQDDIYAEFHHHHSSEGRHPPRTVSGNTLDGDNLVVTFYDSSNFVEIMGKFEFSSLRNDFITIDEEISLNYNIAEKEWGGATIKEFIVGTYTLHNDLNIEIPSDEFKIKSTDYFGGGSKQKCAVCGRRVPDFLITNGPESIYMHEECFKDIKLVGAVILKEHSDLLTKRLI